MQWLKAQSKSYPAHYSPQNEQSERTDLISIGSSGTFDNNMKTLAFVIRFLGICVALWLFYTATTAWLSIYSQIHAGDAVRAIQDHSKSLLIQVFVTKTVPFICFAILLILPYGRLNRILVIGLSCALLWFGFYSWREIFGVFFLSSRLVIESIPLPVIGYTVAFALFLVVFVLVINLNKQKCRTSQFT